MAATIPAPRHMPTFTATVRLMNCGSANERQNGRNIDGVRALKVSMVEAMAFEAAVRDAFAAETDPEWAAEQFERAYLCGGVSKSTAIAYRAYMVARDFLSVEAAEGIIQATIARA